MSEVVLQEWQFCASNSGTSPVIPDGCRDLIYLASPGKRPCWFVTSLDRSVRKVSVRPGDFYWGYRLRPGIAVDTGRLLEAVKSLEPGHNDVVSRIESFSSMQPRLGEALACLASGVANIETAARELGVSARTLQRLVRGHTGTVPAFWTRLARVRKSARAAVHTASLAETALDFGFADQAHMSREFRHWLNVSPLGVKSDSRIKGQLEQRGYC